MYCCPSRNGYEDEVEGFHGGGWGLGSGHTSSWQLRGVGKPWVQFRALSKGKDKSSSMECCELFPFSSSFSAKLNNQLLIRVFSHMHTALRRNGGH